MGRTENQPPERLQSPPGTPEKTRPAVRSVNGATKPEHSEANGSNGTGDAENRVGFNRTVDAEEPVWKRSFFSSRRLRWKLTLSYTLVTIVAFLLVNTLFMVGALAYLSQDSGWMLSEDLTLTTAPRFQEHLVKGSPDQGAIRNVLEEELYPGREEKMSTADKLLYGTYPEDSSLIVMNADRQTLGSISTDGWSPTKERFEAPLDSGSRLAPILEKALGGEDDPDKLYARSTEGDTLTAAPVKGEDGRVVGAVARVYPEPSMAEMIPPMLLNNAVTAIAAGIAGTIFGFLTARGLTRRLQGLAHAAQSWSRGDFSAETRDDSKDELGQLSRELNRMAGELDNLVETRQELATLEARNRFARDLHDSVKQQVFAASLKVDTARAQAGPDTQAGTQMARVKEILGEAQRELNVLIHEMRPAALEGRGLPAALESYLDEWSKRSEIPADFRVRGEREASLEAEQALFRAAQEALANVAKHSGAERAEVDLDYGAEDLTLRVADDGCGFYPARKNGAGSFGLQSMDERLARLGGRVDLWSRPGKGTHVAFVCPLRIACPEEDGHT